MLKDILRTTDKHIKRLKTLGIQNIQGLIQHYPRTYTDQREVRQIMEMRVNETNVIRGLVQGYFSRKTKNGKIMTIAQIRDESGTIEAIWFNQAHITRMIPRGSTVILSGKLKQSFGKLSLISPSYEPERKELIHSGRIVPIYHETEGITSKWIREKLSPLINEWAQMIEDYMPPEILKKHGLLGLKEAVKEIHFPKGEKNLELAKARLGFDELFLIQIKALIKKLDWQRISAKEQKKICIDQKLVEKFLKSLSFELTKAQMRVIKEIFNDLEKKYPMSRLVQGDVGSGKTVVAAMAILLTIKSGYQAAIMAPTEILAKQHYKTLSKLLLPFSLNIQFISGSTKKSAKDGIITQLKTGTCDLIIGTHAIIQEKIGFKNLGLAIIDEQHRFGVKQRAILKSQKSPHLLSLTATPIPRTLAITIYGDQDISEIDEMPKGRKEIITRIVPEKKRIDAYRWIEDQVEKGHQIYVICPLIDESDTIEVKAVKEEFKRLSQEIFPKLKLGLLHGKLKQTDKEQIMEQFEKNQIQILVSTSVVEVGIDVPNATIMVIEGAERFGLSQLHQFRGRVGRGEVQSYCFLFTNTLSMEGQKRLTAMTRHSSGFRLAEIDLKLRGPGEVYGVRQSGIPDLKMAGLDDYATIKKARQAATELLKEDPILLNYPKLQEKLNELDEIYMKD